MKVNKKILQVGLLTGTAIMLAGCSYFVELTPKTEKVNLEYGEKFSLQPKDYLTNDKDVLDKTKVKIVGNRTEEYPNDMTDSISKGEYPVGDYKIVISYDNQPEKTINIDASVRDTTVPVIENLKDKYEVEFGKKLDKKLFDKVATDLSKVEVAIDDSKINYKKAGKYNAVVTAKDEYGNENQKEVIVVVKEEKKVEVVPKKENQTNTDKKHNPPKTEVKPLPKPEEPKKKVITVSVPYINQYAYGAPMGCEGVTLLQALQGKGYAKEYDLKYILDNQPYTDDGNPHHGYVSSPYIVEKGHVYQSIFPKALTPYGNKFGPCKDMSGNSTTQLINELKKGNPSVVYVTYKFRKPIWRTYSFGKCVENMHVMTLTGYNEKTGEYRVMDPAKLGSYWVKKETFERAYNALKFAITVY